MTAVPSLPAFEEFKPFLGDSFTLRGTNGIEISVKLSEISSLAFNRPRERGGKESYSLLFHAAPGSQVSQGMYDFGHPQLGVHRLFLVPVAANAQGMKLQVIFNFA